MKITVQDVKNDFEEIVGWKYVSPGTNDINGIDCSGAWVRCYKKHGFSIYHGSNTIFRTECSSTGKINSESDLKVGMMVFKNRSDGQEPDKFKNDGLGNFYHIGAVVDTNPIKIIHATSPNAKIDTKIGNWSHWGIGNKVDIENNLGSDSVPENETKFIIFAEGGVNLRSAPNKNATRICNIPQNAIVTKIGNDGEAPYWKTNYEKSSKIYTGYIDYTFANPIEDGEDNTVYVDGLGNKTTTPVTDLNSNPVEYATIVIKVPEEYGEVLLNAIKNAELTYG